MKAKRGEIERALDSPSDDIRLFLLYGPDRSGSENLAARLGQAMGAEAERIDLAASDLKSDPALLPDEAAAISLFGDKRYIRIDPAGDEIFAAVEALDEAAKAGNPVVAVADALRGNSRLVKRAHASKRIMAFASYPLEGRDADRMAIEAAQQAGVQLTPDVAHRLAQACSGNRAILESEIAKYANYLDAAPDRPRKLDHDAVNAIGAASEDGDMMKLADLVLSGRVDELDHELERLRAEGKEGIPVLWSVRQRLHLLARLRAEVEQGNSPDSVVNKEGRAIFWREKDMIIGQLRRWRSDALATAIERTLAAERAVKSSGGAGPIGVDEELFAIARKARSLR